MTREEAIKLLRDLWNEVYNEDSDGYNYAMAIDMAIESLQRPTDVDLISRADATAYIERVINSGLGKSKSLDYIHKYISALPSAEADWIPCSERLPLVSGEFLVTLFDNDGTWVSTAQWNMTFGGRWQDIFPNDGYRDISNVIAWKTLPKPYKEESEVEE